MINFLNNIYMFSSKYEINVRVRSKENRSKTAHKSKEKQLKIRKEKLIGKQIKNDRDKKIIQKINKDYVEQDLVYENHKPKLKKLYIYSSLNPTDNPIPLYVPKGSFRTGSWKSNSITQYRNKIMKHYDIIKKMGIQYKTEFKRYNTSYKNILLNGQAYKFSKTLDYVDSYCLNLNESFGNIKYIFDNILPKVLITLIGDYHEYSYVNLSIYREATKLINNKITKPRSFIELRSMFSVCREFGNNSQVYIKVDGIKKIGIDGSITDIESSFVVPKNFYNLGKLFGIWEHLGDFKLFLSNQKYTLVQDFEMQEHDIYVMLCKVSKHNFQQTMKLIKNNSTTDCTIFYFLDGV